MPILLPDDMVAKCNFPVIQQNALGTSVPDILSFLKINKEVSLWIDVILSRLHLSLLPGLV